MTLTRHILVFAAFQRIMTSWQVIQFDLLLNVVFKNIINPPNLTKISYNYYDKLYLFQPFHKNVAVHYQIVKDNEKALPHFIKILELEPNDPQNMFWIAKCSCLLGDFELSKKHCEMIKEKFPDDPVLIPQVNKLPIVLLYLYLYHV